MNYKLFFGLFLIIFTISNIYSIMPGQVSEGITNAEDIVELMKFEGLITTRVQDLLYIAEEYYEAKNYDGAYQKIEEIYSISDEAFKVKDEQKLLRSEIDEASKDINVSEIEQLYLEIESEISDERYQRASDKIDNALRKLSELKSFGVKAKIMSGILGENILTFLNDNKYIILAIILIPTIFYLVFRKKIYRYRLNRKIEEYKIQKKVLKDLVEKLQKEYFESDKLSENDYVVRNKKYEEMMSDIDRKVAVLNEELLK